LNATCRRTTAQALERFYVNNAWMDALRARLVSSAADAGEVMCHIGRWNCAALADVLASPQR
jgi:hypothetical protein